MPTRQTGMANTPGPLTPNMTLGRISRRQEHQRNRRSTAVCPSSTCMVRYRCPAGFSGHSPTIQDMIRERWHSHPVSILRHLGAR